MPSATVTTARRAAPASRVVSVALAGRARGTRTADPLVRRCLVALYDVGDALSIVRRNHGCRPDDCQLCYDARLVACVLDTCECSLEGEYDYTADAALAERREQSAACRARPRRRKPTW
jgi:hypothetical protein